MNIEICKDNENKINEVIKQAQGRARTHMLDYSIVETSIDEAEDLLKREKIEDGTKFEYEDTVNQEYSIGTFETHRKKATTYWRIKKRSNKKWFLIDVKRIKSFNTYYHLKYPIDCALEKSIKCDKSNCVGNWFLTTIKSNIIWSDDERVEDLQTEWFDKCLDRKVVTETFETYFNNYIEEFPEKLI